MFDDQDLERASKELEAYRNDDPLKQILDSYSTLLLDFQRLKSDYEEERNARERYKQIAKQQDRKPFVLVLVDGDGYIFHESLLKGGAEGGRKAAQLLDESIKQSLRGKGLEHCDILVRIYANVAGLSKALSKAGLGGNESRSLAPFIASFNRSYGLYDFVDAGDMKENADFKLRSTLRFYADIPSCRQIYFAACHDVGYISELTPYMSDKSRFTLLDTPGIQFHGEFRKFNLHTERLQGVFRTTPLELNSGTSQSSYSKIPATSAAPTPAIYESALTAYSSTNKTKSACAFFLKGICKNGDKCPFSHLEGVDKTTSSWRERTRSNGGCIQDLPTSSDIPEGCVAVNAEGYRLDPLLPPSSIEASRQLKLRSRRICNEFHVLGSCKNGPNCEYDHAPLGPSMKGGAEALSRSIMCPRKGACRFLNCIRGHICQVPNCGKRGGKEFCRLPIPAHTQSCVPADFVPSIKTSWSFNNGRGSSPSMDGDDDTEYQHDGAMISFENSRGA